MPSRRKKVTRLLMRRLVKNLLKFFRENPEYDMGALPDSWGLRDEYGERFPHLYPANPLGESVR
jgi:hypothetical protein